MPFQLLVIHTFMYINLIFLFLNQWAIKDIPADVKEFPENEYRGTQIKNSAQSEDYLGPKPPKVINFKFKMNQGTGKHKYHFKFFALDVEKMQANDANELLKVLVF